MTRTVIWALVVFVVLGIGWLSAGRQITLFLDRFFTVRAVSLALSPLKYDGGGFVIGGVPLVFATLDNSRADVRLKFDSSNHVILSAGRDPFTLGPRVDPINPSGRPEFYFVTEQGDQLSFTSSQSALSWPTPFEIKIFGGPPCWWRRYVYYQFFWTRRSGAKLEMRWRYQQQYRSASGWSKPAMMWNSLTALLSADIHSESAVYEDAVMQYVARARGWNRKDYRIERRGPASDGQCEVSRSSMLTTGAPPIPGPASRSNCIWIEAPGGSRAGRAIA